MSSQTLTQQNRVYWLDAARVLAIVCIVFCHACTRSFSIGFGTLAELETYGWAFSVGKAVLYVFSRLGVPLFLMITGALLLGRDYTAEGKMERFYKHNWLPILRTTVIWFGIMYLYLSLFHDSVLRTQGLGKAVLKFFETILFVNQVTFPSMWYMPMILCLYLLIPIMALSLAKFGDKYFMWLVNLAVVLTFIIPNLNALLKNFGADFSIQSALGIGDFFSIYFCYLFIGYWVRKGCFDKLPTWCIALGGLLSFGLTVAYQIWMYAGPTDYNIRYEDLGILITSFFLFNLLKRKGDVLQFARPVTEQLSRYAFGIYFIHICIMRGLVFVFKHWHMDLYPYGKFVILFVVSFGLSWLIIALTERIPFFRKYLYMIK